ncbi:MAG: hypothetical protein IT181_20640 [Acidobacteria bacterium]|nr:hypothetical protein [Acidobacteriota bacterium]
MKLGPPPGSPERKRLFWLVALVAVLAGILWWRQPAPASAPVGEAAQPAANAAGGQTGPLPMPDAVKLASLEDVPVLSEVGRNPFGFGVRPLPPPPPPMDVRPVQGPPPGPPLPAVPSGPPAIGLKLAGMTVPVEGGRTMVTLIDPATSTTYLAYEGDIVDGRYRVVKVGVQSVVVSYVDGTGLRTLSLGG